MKKGFLLLIVLSLFISGNVLFSQENQNAIEDSLQVTEKLSQEVLSENSETDPVTNLLPENPEENQQTAQESVEADSEGEVAENETSETEITEEIAETQDEITDTVEESQSEEIAESIEEVEKTDSEESEITVAPDSLVDSVQLQIVQYRQEINAYVELNKEQLSEKINPDDVIKNIEALKAEIYAKRQEIQKQEDDYLEKKNAELLAAADNIINAPLDSVETDDFGTQTKESIARRKSVAQKILDDGEAEKKETTKQLWDSIKEDEKLQFAELNKMYSELTGTKYKTSTFTDELSLAVGNFDGKAGKWTVTLSSKIADHEALVNEKFELKYNQVTGKKFIPVDKMTEVQFEDFKNTAAIYDGLFQTQIPVLYARLSYKVANWQNASEYRFVPDVIEIVKIQNGKEKVIHKLPYSDPKVFTEFPTVEVRSEKQIAKEKEKTVNILEKELKAKEKRLGVKLYTNPDVAAKNYNKDPVIQKGRGSFLLSVSDIEDFTQASVALDHVQADMTFGIGKFGFLGFDGGMDFPFAGLESVFNGGIQGGMNVKIGQILRPYALIGADYFTDYKAVARVGGGLDLVLIKVICLNIGYSYNWEIGLSEYLNPSVRQDKISQAQDLSLPISSNHKFNIGFGIAW